MAHVARMIGTMLALAASTASAVQSVGDWHYEIRSGLYAATASDTGSLFGQWCDATERRCVYLMAIPLECAKGERYLLLSNSDSSANGVEVMCRGPLGSRDDDGRALYRYAFTNFDSIDHQVHHSSRIGFAFPMAGDAFHVARFSLAGAVAAIAAMRGAAQSQPPVSRSGRRAGQRP